MSGSGTTELVNALLARFNAGDVDGALELIDDDFVGVVGPDVSAEPDTYVGHDGVRRYWAGYAGVMEDVRFDVREVVERGDRVALAVDVSGRGAASGIEVSLPGAVVWHVRDGRVVRMEAVADMDTAQAALAQPLPAGADGTDKRP